MTSCDDFNFHILDLLDDEKEAIPEEIVRHLDTCERCSKELHFIQNAHSAVKESLNVLAPQKSYLTDERLENVLNSCNKTTQEHREDKIINIHWRTKLKYMMEGAATVAAMMALTIGYIWVFGQSGIDQENKGIQAVASSDTESQEVTEKYSASFLIINDFDMSTNTNADTLGDYYFDMALRKESSDKMIPLSSQGIKVPVQKTTALRQDDYWW